MKLVAGITLTMTLMFLVFPPGAEGLPSLEDKPSPRIIQGSKANPNIYPWLAHIYIKDPYTLGLKHHCGGSLVARNFVLTAAHCVTTNKPFCDGANYHTTIWVEVHNFFWENPKIFTHHKYDDCNMIHAKYHDISLLFLEPKHGVTLEPIRLPVDSDLNYFGTEGTVLGWGMTIPNDPNSMSYFLKKMRVYIYSGINEACEHYDNGISTTLCLLSEDSSSVCVGDSGGPLIVEQWDGQPLLLGLSSFGSVICGTGQPVIYTRVYSYLKWIENVLGQYYLNSQKSLRSDFVYN